MIELNGIDVDNSLSVSQLDPQGDYSLKVTPPLPLPPFIPFSLKRTSKRNISNINRPNLFAMSLLQKIIPVPFLYFTGK